MDSFDEFVKENKINELTEQEANEELIHRIKESKNHLNNMYNNLQFVDSDLVDYYTYQIKAEEAKYGFLIKQAKNNNIDNKKEAY